MHFKDSPYWNVFLQDVEDVHIWDVKVTATNTPDGKPYKAFNTDGIDIAGNNVHVHDVEIINGDDCIAVKEQHTGSIHGDCSENMVFENIRASGQGLTIGAITPAPNNPCAQNIIFRNVFMNNTQRGPYVKSQPPSNTTKEYLAKAKATISNILYDNITIVSPLVLSHSL